jgi:hypothetical protein
MVELKEAVALDLDLESRPDMLPLQTFANAFDNPDLRQRVLDIEAFMLQQEQVDIPLRHTFAQGVYAREMTAPAGVVLTGRIHKTEHLNIISKGEVSVLTENGIERFKAPYTFVSKPGTKRILYAHEELVWTTIHVTNETDLAKLEAELVASSFEELETERVTLRLKEN